MLQVTLNITLILEGPILTKSSSPGNFGVDASMAINHEGKYSIPGTLVKGKLREAWEELAGIAPSSISEDKITFLLGEESGNEENRGAVNPIRGILRFSEFISEKKATQTFSRIRMNKETGTVDKGALLIMETPFRSGEKACFHGTIGFASSGQPEIAKIRDYIDKGLRWTSSFGSEQTVGFGKLISVGISEDIKAIQLTQADDSLLEDDKIALVIIPRAPFCIAKRRISKNLYESEEFISGGMIKGTIASVWSQLIGKSEGVEIDKDFDKDREELCRYFDKIRFTHAFPARAYNFKRPVRPPLSLVKFDKDEPYCDVARCGKPVLMIKNDKYKAPAFDIDWKNSSDVNNDFGWAELQKELRVRTAIDSSKRRAKEKELFAYEMVVPTGFHWLGWIDLGLVCEDDRQKVSSQLGELLVYGLKGLGKTKASANVEPKVASSIQPQHFSHLNPVDDQYILTLQTPAILCDPEELDETSGRDKLFGSYKIAWDQLSDNSLSLVRYFARQTLEGGYYLQRRFQSENSYKPYLLTEAGSVFVFNITDKDKAQEKIRDWHAHGLPLPEWRKKYTRNNKAGDHWSNCPYIRENGYGEIAVNLDIHKDKSPEKALKSCCICYISENGQEEIVKCQTPEDVA